MCTSSLQVQYLFNNYSHSDTFAAQLAVTVGRTNRKNEIGSCSKLLERLWRSRYPIRPGNYWCRSWGKFNCLSKARRIITAASINVPCPWKRYSTPLFKRQQSHQLLFSVHTLVSPLSITACECIMIIFSCANLYSFICKSINTKTASTLLCFAHCAHTRFSVVHHTAGECIMIIYFLVCTSFLIHLQVD